jgi:hypothetical protein
MHQPGGPRSGRFGLDDAAYPRPVSLTFVDLCWLALGAGLPPLTGASQCCLAGLLRRRALKAERLELRGELKTLGAGKCAGTSRALKNEPQPL